MKRIFFGFMMLVVFSASAALTEQQAKQLYQDKNYNELITQIDNNASQKVVKYKVHAYVKQKEFEQAVDLIESRIKAFDANNKAGLSKEWLMKGDVHAQQAMDASIFTASSYAEDCLNAYKTAHKLQPDDLVTNKSLIGFYMGAPSFVGGDTDKAYELAQLLEKNFPYEGGMTVFHSLKSLDEIEKAESKLQALLTDYPKNHEIALQAVYFYQQQEWFEKNQQLLNQSITWLKPEDEEQHHDWFLVHYYHAKNSIELKTDLDKALASIKTFQQGPTTLTEAFEQWPVLREAQILLLMGEKQQAITLAKQARSASEDKKLRKKAKRLIKKGRI
ncbi:hypothetical protein L2734_18030 [Parashewanella spongiae]|nr:hypothetical protein [Parashewanella spongiae]MCL1080031.1 hypothetical protein [Parashewanella spongiae]